MYENPYPPRTPGWWAWTRLQHRGIMDRVGAALPPTLWYEIINTTLKASGIDADQRQKKGLRI